MGLCVRRIAVTRLIPLLLIALGGALLSCAPYRAARGGQVPQFIRTCERHNEWVCGVWTKTPEGYVAQFDQGTTADITITRFDADSIILVRTDRPGHAPYNPPYTTAVYRAAPRGRTVRNGKVTWQQSGQVFSGVWKANW